MHSAAIDVGKILSDEIDDKAWDSYLKGNRGVFTSRAVRLIGGSETRAIRAHYESDAEFQRSVNRYVHDFESMLRRVLAERDGGDHRGHADVVGHGQALRGAGAGDRQAPLRQGLSGCDRSRDRRA